MRNLIFLFLIFIVPTNALGLIEVDITRGNLNPLPIAVSPLSIDDESKKSFEKTLKKKDIGSEISKVIEKNLKTSGLFNPLDKNAFLQAPDIAHLKPRFEDWNLIKAQALITGKVKNVDDKLCRSGCADNCGEGTLFRRQTESALADRCSGDNTGLSAGDESDAQTTVWVVCAHHFKYGLGSG